jgi:hypothetical protein
MLEFPSTIREINALPPAEKETIYRTLLPEWIFSEYNIDPLTLCVSGQKVVRYRFPENSRAVEISVKRYAQDRDPLLYCHITDTFSNQLLVLLVVVNDPDSPRFNTDIDQDGNPTHLASTGRNIPAEIEAKKNGLAPGQVRQGLRSFKTLVPIFETFAARMGHDLFFIEPLAYHNAYVFERYGFGYVRGLKAMKEIHQGFQEGGKLRIRLNSSTPFRSPEAHATVRGRSWAIHDGILGHPFTGFQMVKRLEHHAQINTFPDAVW